MMIIGIESQGTSSKSKSANITKTSQKLATSICVSLQARPVMIVGQDEREYLAVSSWFVNKWRVRPKGQGLLLPKSEGDGWHTSNDCRCYQSTIWLKQQAGKVPMTLVGAVAEEVWQWLASYYSKLAESKPYRQRRQNCAKSKGGGHKFFWVHFVTLANGDKCSEVFSGTRFLVHAKLTANFASSFLFEY